MLDKAYGKPYCYSMYNLPAISEHFSLGEREREEGGGGRVLV